METEDKTVAIVSYLTLIGWIIALVLHNQNPENKTALGTFHLRQALGLMLLGLIFTFIPVLGWILNVGIFIFWILGLIAAVQGEQKPVPLIGETIQNLITFIQ